MNLPKKKRLERIKTNQHQKSQSTLKSIQNSTKYINWMNGWIDAYEIKIDMRSIAMKGNQINEQNYGNKIEAQRQYIIRISKVFAIQMEYDWFDFTHTKLMADQINVINQMQIECKICLFAVDQPSSFLK